MYCALTCPLQPLLQGGETPTQLDVPGNPSLEPDDGDEPPPAIDKVNRPTRPEAGHLTLRVPGGRYVHKPAV